MYSFVLKFGAEDLLLRTISLGKTSNVGPEIYEVLCQDPKPALSNPLLHLRHGLLRMAYTGPEKIVSSSDCKKIFHKDYKSNVEKTNALMMLVNEMIRQHVSVKSLEIDEAYLKFEREVILCTIGKAHKDVESRDSIEEAAVFLVGALENVTGKRLSDQWNAAKKPAQQAPPSSSSSAVGATSKPNPLILPYRLKVPMFVFIVFSCYG